MLQFIDPNWWQQLWQGSLGQLADRLVEFTPGFLGASLILVIGWAISKVIEMIATRALHRFGLDNASDRLRVSETLLRGGIGGRPSVIAGRLLFWLLMLTFLLSAVETLGVTSATETIDRLIGFLPNIVASGLILIVGLLAARLIRNVVASSAAATSLTQADRLGAASQVLVAIVVVVLALEQIGVETELLVTLMTALVAGLTVTLGLCFALGARGVVTHILAGHYLRQRVAVGRTIEAEDKTGIVEEVGPVSTLIRVGETNWNIPNGRLLDQLFALR